MWKFRGDFQNLYQMEGPHPPGLLLATHVGSYKVNEEVPSEAELEAAVRRLRPHSAGGTPTSSWNTSNSCGDSCTPGSLQRPPPRRELLLYLVDIVQHMCHTRNIPQELEWTVLVLIPKGITNIRGISLLETLWKVVEALIDTRLLAILQMHNVLHGFRSGRGMGKAIMELKLAQ